MTALQDRIKSLTGNKRTFLLMRIAGLDVDFSKKLTSVTRGTYNSWFKNEEFALLYHKLPILIQDYRIDAVQLLRKDNQLEAVLLEGKIISKIKEEIEAGDYKLTRTHLAREVYSKLMTDLDIIPEVKFTWQQRFQGFFQRPPEQIGEGVVDAEFSEVGSEQTQHQESDNVSDIQSPDDEAAKTIKE